MPRPKPMTVTRIALLFALAVASSASVVRAQAPPPSSPAARGERPRLFFTASDIPEIRQRIKAHYAADFQQLLDQLGNPKKLSSGQREHEADWGSMNAALVAALGPSELAALGFSLPSGLQTPAALCSQAMSYARTQLPRIASATKLGHSAFTTGYSYAIYLPVMATYDWCHDRLSDAERREIADAFVAMYDKKYGGRNALTMEINGQARLANNQAAVGVHDILGIIALWGDPHPTGAVQAEMYKTFDTLWNVRVMNELKVFYEHGANWLEGPGGYFTEGFTTLALGFAAISPALGRPYAAELPLFTGFGTFVHAVTRPNTVARTCGSSGREQCPPYYDRWGTISGGISGPACAPMMLAAGMLRYQKLKQPAGLLKWAIDNYRGGCEGTDRRYGSTWFNGWKWFLMGDRGIEAVGPDTTLPRAIKHGLDLYTMRSGYDSAASQVLFFGQQTNTYGHGSMDYGSFTLHKHGNLILHAANGKSGDGAFVRVPSSAPSTGSLFRNVLTLHRGATHAGLGIQTYGKREPRFEKLGIMSSIKTAGVVTAESLNTHGFDYVSYDISDLYLDTTATVSQREFLYLHGQDDHEYLVIFDRFHARKPDADEKIWRIWVPTKPEFVNGVATQPREGKWTSSTATVVAVTNKGGGVSGDNFRSGPTNGRFFMKTIQPANAIVNLLGGDGMEFQSGDDDGSLPWGAPAMSKATREYLGWGRIEVRPSVTQPYDTFLNVIQFGSADGLNAMAATHRLATADGRMLGTHIADPANEWIVLFAQPADAVFNLAGATYAFHPQSSTSKHALFNMRRNAQYYIATSSSAEGTKVTISGSAGGGGTLATTGADGALHFTLSGLTVTAPVTPQSPNNLRLRDQPAS